MSANALKSKLAAGEAVFGVWSIIASPAVVEITAQAGMDFVILDGEHGIFDFATLEACARAAEASGCAPLARSPGIDQYYAQTALDIGVHGLVIPQVADYQAALQAVQLTKYGPAGMRGFNPFTRAGYYGAVPLGQSSKQRDEFVFTAINIENLKAYEELDRILTIPALDMLYLGVYDMSVAMGVQGHVKHPRVLEFVESATRRIRAAGKAVGAMAHDQESMQALLALGANFIVYYTDTVVIQRAMAEKVAWFQAAKQGAA